MLINFEASWSQNAKNIISKLNRSKLGILKAVTTLHQEVVDICRLKLSNISEPLEKAKNQKHAPPPFAV